MKFTDITPPDFSVATRAVRVIDGKLVALASKPQKRSLRLAPSGEPDKPFVLVVMYRGKLRPVIDTPDHIPYMLFEA